MSEANVVFLDMPKTRVYLRPPEKGDLPFFVRTLNDEEIAIFLQGHQMVTFTEEEEWLANLPKRKNTDKVCSIVLKETNEVIGVIALHRIDWINRTATTGTFIGRKDLLGKGLGTEAKMMLLKHAFLTLNLRQIYSGVNAFNGRSIRYSEKCGYREIARFPNHVFRNGEYHDLVHLMLTREMWQPLWVEFEQKMKGETL